MLVEKNKLVLFEEGNCGKLVEHNDQQCMKVIKRKVTKIERYPELETMVMEMDLSNSIIMASMFDEDNEYTTRGYKITK